MNLLDAFLLGLIQGVAEWLPISSSGHLALYRQFRELHVPMAFDVALHLATAAVTLWVFRSDVAGMARALVRRDLGSPEGRLAMTIVLASIPTAIIGLALRGPAEALEERPMALAAALLVTGALLHGADRGGGQGDWSWWRALLVGVAQGLAVTPGISRSGATIACAIYLGVERDRAARASFLMAVPAIAGAAILTARDLEGGVPLDLLAVATATAAAVSLVSLPLVLAVVRRRRLRVFAWWCWAVGGSALAWFGMH
ncbi:MAG: undecaprenyl-diphosphate phosphatase [Planctomycetes bacterium]|nr:undecaprenyl-diphosphate phosphatase [Planctomycetota bacterium]